MPTARPLLRLPLVAAALFLAACAAPPPRSVNHPIMSGIAWKDVVTSADPDLHSLGYLGYFFENDLVSGDPDAARIAFLIVSGPKANDSQLHESYWEIAAALHEADLGKGGFWANVEMLDTERQRALVLMLDCMSKSPCCQVTDWDDERAAFLQKHPDAHP